MLLKKNQANIQQDDFIQNNDRSSHSHDAAETMKYVSFFLTPSLSPIILSLPSSSVLMFKS
jgi:hypothetical protein